MGRHGGVGANTMNDKYYAQSEVSDSLELRDRFLADAEKVGNIHVDIALPESSEPDRDHRPGRTVHRRVSAVFG